MEAKLNAAVAAIKGGIRQVVIAPGALERGAARITAGDKLAPLSCRRRQHMRNVSTLEFRRAQAGVRTRCPSARRR